MKFSTKILCAIVSTTLITCAIGGSILYCSIKSNIEEEYFARYQSLGEIMANTFIQMENSANLINENAAQVLYEIEKNSGLPTHQKLNQLAKELGVKAFYVTNKQGRFIRSTDLPLKLQTNSLFSYCKDYHLLVNGQAKLYRTPIIPGFPYNIPMKLTMIPNHNRNLILESGMELEYIGKILHQAIKSDLNIKSIGFYTPTGFELGYISESGKYHRGRRNIFLNLNDLSQHKIEKGKSIFNIKIPSIDPYCCECIYKKVSPLDGKYFYILRMEVSLNPLISKIYFLRARILFILIVVCVLSIFLSRILAKKLVSRIENINKIVSNIIECNNLNLRVDIKNKSDEIGKLGETFNKMVHGLKISQDRLIEIEKIQEIAKLSAQLVHDIRSPLAVMEMAILSLPSHTSKTQQTLLHQAIQSVRDIANNVLIRYRQQGDKTMMPPNNIHSDGNLSRSILLSSTLEFIMSQKRQEWLNKPCTLTLEMTSKAKMAWIDVSPNATKRILSNLLNNAYESLQYTRDINLKLLNNENVLQLEINDTGQGIPKDKINDVLNGLSLKHAGKGFGLTSAREYIETMGGKLILSSIEGKGTQVTLLFPFAHQPTWFPESILLPENSTILILDDDPSIHNLWQHRLEAHDLSCKHFIYSDDLLRWLEKNPTLGDKAIFFLDYELYNDHRDGLLLLEKLNTKSRGYLITSHAEEIFVQRRCTELGVWLLPKNLLGEIKLKVSTIDV